MRRAGRGLALAILACGACGAIGAIVQCRAPTAVTLKLSAGPNCTAVTRVDIAVAASPEDAELRARQGFFAATTSNASCQADGTLGTLTVTPGSTRGAVIAVATLGDRPCRPEDGYADCVVARRTFSFADHTTLILPIGLEPSCLNLPCDVQSTCVNARCVSSEVVCVDASCDVDPDAVVAPGADSGPSDGGPDDADVAPGTDASRDASTPRCRGRFGANKSVIMSDAGVWSPSLTPDEQWLVFVEGVGDAASVVTAGRDGGAFERSRQDTSPNVTRVAVLAVHTNVEAYYIRDGTLYDIKLLPDGVVDAGIHVSVKPSGEPLFLDPSGLIFHLNGTSVSTDAVATVDPRITSFVFNDDETLLFTNNVDGGPPLMNHRAIAAPGFDDAGPIDGVDTPGALPGWLSPDECRFYYSAPDGDGGSTIYLATRDQ